MLDYGGEAGILSLVASHREGNTNKREREQPMTGYEYEIQGNYGYGWDLLTTEPDIKSARAQLKVYSANESIPLRIKRVKESV